MVSCYKAGCFLDHPGLFSFHVISGVKIPVGRKQHALPPQIFSLRVQDSYLALSKTAQKNKLISKSPKTRCLIAIIENHGKVVFHSLWYNLWVVAFTQTLVSQRCCNEQHRHGVISKHESSNFILTKAYEKRNQHAATQVLSSSRVRDYSWHGLCCACSLLC